MPRYFESITKAELVEKIVDTGRNGFYPVEEDDPDALYYSALYLRHNYPRIEKDLSKVIFDHENFEMEPEEDGWPAKVFVGLYTLENGLTYLGACAGGDWEVPVYYIIYWDGKSLRAYIPKEGNTYNQETKTAFGSEEERDYEKYKDYWDQEEEPVVPDPNVELMIEDIKSRIVRRHNND